MSYIWIKNGIKIVSEWCYNSNFNYGSFSLSVATNGPNAGHSSVAFQFSITGLLPFRI